MLIFPYLFEYTDCICVWELYKKTKTVDSNFYEIEEWQSVEPKVLLRSTDPKAMNKKDEAAQAFANGLTEITSMMEMTVIFVQEQMKVVYSQDYALKNIQRITNSGKNLTLYSDYYRVFTSQVVQGVQKEQNITIYKVL